MLIHLLSCFGDLLSLILNCRIKEEENNLKLPETRGLGGLVGPGGGLGGLVGPGGGLGGPVSSQQDSTNSPVRTLEMLMAINTISVCECVCANDAVNGETPGG